MKKLIRSVLWALHLDVTRNLRYDRLTWKVMRKVLTPNSNCVDVGCHKGELLDWMLQLSPKGKHFAFEPIPELNENLHLQYDSRGVQIFSYALSDESGKKEFQLVRNAPAYSGLKKRTYAVAQPDIEVIDVEVKRLDKIIPDDLAITLIKVDVEGAEYQVLKGASALILSHKPTILFEFGLGAADHYNVQPHQMFELMEQYNMNIFTLKSFLRQGSALSAIELENHFRENSEYYFVAFPKNAH
jgi:FkbM family methyltransferase